MNKSRKTTFIAFVIIAFIFLCLGGLSTVIGAVIKENRLIYLGLTLLGIGFVLYVILFFILIKSVSDKYSKKDNNNENKK
ncbi:MAG: hypothetical protein J5936_00865 [Acholeplasmatales bacterium]|nr:hypothetical protein [Acholeplasmatales bacterium]